MTKLLGKLLLGYFFKSKWYDTNCFEKLEGGYLDAHEKD
jgi:hypothetical protein